MSCRSVEFAITGPDGSGKSTVGNELKELLLGKFPELAIYKGYRPASITLDGETSFKFEFLTRFVELLHKLGDRTKNKRLISLANTVQVLYVSRLLEPFLKRKYTPDVVYHSRDIKRIDPAVYGEMYSGIMSKLTVKDRLTLLSKLTGKRYRDFIFFLNTNPTTSMERIVARMEEEKGKELSAEERVKFQHMHENIDGLTELNIIYLKVIAEILKIHPETPIFEIPTGEFSKQEVATILLDVIQTWFECDSTWQGWFIFNSITGQFEPKLDQ